MRPPPLDLAALLARPPEGVAVSQDLAAAEILLRAPSSAEKPRDAAPGWSPLRLVRALLAAQRDAWVSLDAQRFSIGEGRKKVSFELDSVRSIAAAPPADDPAPRRAEAGELTVQTSDGRFVLLRGYPLGDLCWLAVALRAAVDRRRYALLAAGHDLSRPPPEADALRAVARRVGGPARE